MEKFKKCSKCHETKNVLEFYPCKLKKDGYKYYCKECSKKISRLNYKNNTERVKQQKTKWRENNPEKYKNIKLKKYGITIKDYNNMLEKQLNKCKICKEDQNSFRRPLVIDHCHTTGKVRGLLCDACNTSLGKLQENTETLKNMIKYIEEHKKTQI